MRFLLILLSALVGAASIASPTLTAQTPARDFQLFTQLRPRAGYLGVAIADVDADRVSRLKLSEERGVEVTNVEEGSPADVAGIKPGDVLLTYNGETILGSQQFVRLVRETPVARKVHVSLWRNGKEQSLMVTTAAVHTRSVLPGIVGPNEEEFSGLANFHAPDMRGFAMPDVPMVIMAWNSASLGVECEPVDNQLAGYFGVKQGVLVRSVGKGTAAEKAGIKAGDVLTSVGGRALKTPDDFRRIMRAGSKPIAVSLMRDHKQLTLNLTPLSDRDE